MGYLEDFPSESEEEIAIIQEHKKAGMDNVPHNLKFFPKDTAGQQQ